MRWDRLRALKSNERNKHLKEAQLFWGIPIMQGYMFLLGLSGLCPSLFQVEPSMRRNDAPADSWAPEVEVVSAGIGQQ